MSSSALLSYEREDGAGEESGIAIDAEVKRSERPNEDRIFSPKKDCIH
jgi:hypothetical protein